MFILFRGCTLSLFLVPKTLFIPSSAHPRHLPNRPFEPGRRTSFPPYRRMKRKEKGKKKKHNNDLGSIGVARSR